MDDMTKMLMEIQRSTAETATNVHYLRSSFEEHKTAITKTLNDHIEEDKEDRRTLYGYITPLLKKDEQAKGAEEQSNKTARRFKFAYSVIVPVVSALFGYLGGKGGH